MSSSFCSGHNLVFSGAVICRRNSLGFGEMKEALRPPKTSWKKLLRTVRSQGWKMFTFLGPANGRVGMCVCLCVYMCVQVYMHAFMCACVYACVCVFVHSWFSMESTRSNASPVFDSSLPGGFICMILDLSEHLGRI